MLQVGDIDTSPEGRRKRFGARLKKAREDAGLTQGEAAEGAGVSQQVISKLESKGVASEDVLIRVHVLYDLRISYPSAPLDPVRREEWFQSYQFAGYRSKGPIGAVSK